MVNGNHPTPNIFGTTSQEIPEQLEDIKEAFTTWVPPLRKLKVGSAFLECFTRPRVNLTTIWPAFAKWLIMDEIYGVKQFLPKDDKLLDLVREIVNLLDLESRSEKFNEKYHVDLQAQLLPFGERLTSADNPAAGCAWQCVFNCTSGIASLALRYGMAANTLGQPQSRNVIIGAVTNSYMGKMFDLLKL